MMEKSGKKKVKRDNSSSNRIAKSKNTTSTTTTSSSATVASNTTKSKQESSVINNNNNNYNNDNNVSNNKKTIKKTNNNNKNIEEYEDDENYDEISQIESFVFNDDDTCVTIGVDSNGAQSNCDLFEQNDPVAIDSDTRIKLEALLANAGIESMTSDLFKDPNLMQTLTNTYVRTLNKTPNRTSTAAIATNDNTSHNMSQNTKNNRQNDLIESTLEEFILAAAAVAAANTCSQPTDKKDNQTHEKFLNNSSELINKNSNTEKTVNECLDSLTRSDGILSKIIQYKPNINNDLICFSNQTVKPDGGSSNSTDKSELVDSTTAAAAEAIAVVASKKLAVGKSLNELLEENADSVLGLACASGYVELVSVLLDINANVEDKGLKNESTPLIEACANGHEQIVELLLKHGANINAQSSCGNTPLHYAVQHNYTNIVKLLINHSADINTKVKLKLEEPNENGHTPLMEAASAGHVECARLLVEAGADVNTHSTEFKETPLTLACYKGHVEMVKFLLEKGANIEHKTDEMHTPLMEACMDGHVEVARILIENGALVNMPADSFESPLTLAACGGHDELATLLISHHADLEERNDEGYTPLMEAAREGHEEMVTLLLFNDADINAITEETQETALTLACCGGCYNVAKFLLEAGADPNLGGASTPLMEAAQEGHLELVQLLIKAGAEINKFTTTVTTTNTSSQNGNQTATTTTTSCESALTLACENGHTDVVDALMKAGADMDQADPDKGFTPLMKACRTGQHCTVQYLLNNCLNIDVNRSTKNNEHTALSLACQNGHIQVVELLLQHGANPLHTLKENSNCLIEAAKGGHTKIVELLIDWNYALNCNTQNDDVPETDEEIIKKDQTELVPSPSVPFDTDDYEFSFDETDKCCRISGSASGGCGDSSPIPFDMITDNDTTNKNINNITHNNKNEISIRQFKKSVPLLDTSSDVGLENLVNVLHYFAFGNNDDKPIKKEDETDKLKLPVASAKNNTQNKNSLLHLSLSIKNKSEQATRNTDEDDEDEQIKRKESLLHELLTIEKQLEGQKQAIMLKSADTAKQTGNTISINSDNYDHISMINKYLIKKCQYDLNRLYKIKLRRLQQKPFEINTNKIDKKKSSICLDSNNNTDQKSTITSSLTSSVSLSEIQPSLYFKSAAQAVSSSSSPPSSPPPPTPPPPPPPLKSNNEKRSLSKNKQQSESEMVCTHNNHHHHHHHHFHHDPAVKSFKLKKENNKNSSTPPAPPLLSPSSTSSTSTSSDDWSPPPPFAAAAAYLIQQSMKNKATQNNCPHIDLDAATETSNDTALTVAVAGGHEELVKLLIEKGAHIEHRNKKGYTPLILAATLGHSRIIDTLLTYGADVEAQSDRNKDTALSAAAQAGKFECCEILLIKGQGNKEHRNVSDYTPLSLAASGGYVNIIKLLIKHGAEINSRTGSKLGITPLMLAAMNGHTHAVKLLIDMGADVNAQIETNRNTALTLACFQGRADVVSLLVEKRANIEHRAKTGLTPLMEAASGGYENVGRILLERGADVNASPVHVSKDTALIIAAEKGHLKFVQLLIDYGAYLEAKNKKGSTALWLACNNGHLDVVQTLIIRQADSDSCDSKRVSCLMAAFKKGHIKICKYLVRFVKQFPSDQDCLRYITSINTTMPVQQTKTSNKQQSDKDLIKRCQQCMDLIVQAKDKQAQEANRVALNLLKEIDAEKSREQNKKAAAQRKREKRKQKKKEQQLQQQQQLPETVEESKNKKKTNENKPKSSVEIKQSLEKSRSQSVSSDSSDSSDSELSDKSDNEDLPELDDFPIINSINEPVKSSRSKMQEKNQSVRSKSQTKPAKPGIKINPPTPAGATKQKEPTSKKYVNSVVSYTEVVKNATKPIKPTSSPSKNHLSELDDFDQPALKPIPLASVIKPKQISYKNVLTNKQAVTGATTTTTTTITRSQLPTPISPRSRTQRVVIPNEKFLYVIGRNNSNIKRIQEFTGAVLEVEEKKIPPNQDSSILVRGDTNDIVKNAVDQLNSIINEDHTQKVIEPRKQTSSIPAKSHSVTNKNNYNPLIDGINLLPNHHNHHHYSNHKPRNFAEAVANQPIPSIPNEHALALNKSDTLLKYKKIAPVNQSITNTNTTKQQLIGSRRHNSVSPSAVKSYSRPAQFSPSALPNNLNTLKPSQPQPAAPPFIQPNKVIKTSTEQKPKIISSTISPAQSKSEPLAQQAVQTGTNAYNKYTATIKKPISIVAPYSESSTNDSAINKFKNKPQNSDLTPTPVIKNTVHVSPNNLADNLKFQQSQQNNQHPGAPPTNMDLIIGSGSASSTSSASSSSSISTSSDLRTNDLNSVKTSFTEFGLGLGWYNTSLCMGQDLCKSDSGDNKITKLIQDKPFTLDNSEIDRKTTVNNKPIGYERHKGQQSSINNNTNNNSISLFTNGVSHPIHENNPNKSLQFSSNSLIDPGTNLSSNNLMSNSSFESMNLNELSQFNQKFNAVVGSGYQSLDQFMNLQEHPIHHNQSNISLPTIVEKNPLLNNASLLTTNQPLTPQKPALPFDNLNTNDLNILNNNYSNDYNINSNSYNSVNNINTNSNFAAMASLNPLFALSAKNDSHFFNQNLLQSSSNISPQYSNLINNNKPNQFNSIPQQLAQPTLINYQLNQFNFASPLPLASTQHQHQQQQQSVDFYQNQIFQNNLTNMNEFNFYQANNQFQQVQPQYFDNYKNKLAQGNFIDGFNIQQHHGQ